MISPRLLPIAMIVLSILAAGVYACQGDLRHTLYWTAGAVLNASVTF